MNFPLHLGIEIRDGHDNSAVFNMVIDSRKGVSHTRRKTTGTKAEKIDMGVTIYAPKSEIENPTPSAQVRIAQALEVAVKFGGTDEIQHLHWIVDQMVRVLAGNDYDNAVKEAKDGEDGPDTYEWQIGIAP